MPPLLTARDVTKRFGGLTAVNKLNVDIEENAIHSIIGPNGAGKTTFFNCVTGFYRHEEGTVLFKGEPLDGMQPDRITREGIGRTYQNIRLFQNMTVIENVMVGYQSHLTSGWIGAVFHSKHQREEEKNAVEEARKMLNFVGLAGRGDWMSKNLPYGDQRRLEIGRALATKPDLLLLDEPAAGMNPSETADLMEFIKRLRDRTGHHHSADRAPHAGGHGHLGPGYSYGLRRKDRGRHAAGGPEESDGHRSLSGKGCDRIWHCLKPLTSTPTTAPSMR